jgi:hypothetical protein
MANMQAVKITRTAVSDNVRLLEVHTADGEVRVLGTEIHKVRLPEAFIKAGGKTVPVEQYAFKVGGMVVARFADATALVFKRHHIAISQDAEGSQNYVREALAIIRGEKELRLATAEFC